MQNLAIRLWSISFAICLLGLLSGAPVTQSDNEIASGEGNAPVTFRFGDLVPDAQATVMGLLGPTMNMQLVNRDFNRLIHDYCRDLIVRTIPEFREQPFLLGDKACLFRNTFFRSFEASETIRVILGNSADRSVRNILMHLIDRYAYHLPNNEVARKKAVSAALKLELPRNLLKPLLVHKSDEDGKCLWYYAILNGDLPFISLFLDLNLRSINSRSPAGETLLHVASRLPNGFQVAIYALDRGVDIEARDRLYEDTALHLAVRVGNLDLISLLREHGANIHALNGNRESPLSLAFRNESPDAEMIRRLTQ